MDPVTHGITGALLSKGYFSDRYGKAATFALVLGAVFPDVDITADLVSRDPLAIVKYHRALTHSFVALPVFAFLLALLTRALLPAARRKFESWRDVESPPLGILTLIYGIGIASHILLDGMTSFGTRMWYPLSTRRVAWDLLFIIDFSFTSIVLLPQLLAWIYPSGPDASPDIAKSRSRALRMWLICTAITALVWLLARAAGYPFRLWVAGIVVAVLAAIFFGPAIGGWGFRVERTAWCQAGVVVMVAYLFCCALAHHSAMLRVKTFADSNHVAAERMAALPIPPSLLDWGDAIRGPEGLFESQFDLRTKTPPEFWYIPDSPPDMYIQRAAQLPSVQLYWQFARFPGVHSFQRAGRHYVDFGENRFSDGRQRSPQPFTYRVVFDQAGNLLQQGWLTTTMIRPSSDLLAPQPQVSQPPKISP